MSTCIFNALPTATIVFDRSLNIKDFNDSAVSLHGTGDIEVINRGLKDYPTWKDLQQAVKTALQGESSIVEYRYYNPSYEKAMWVKGIVNPVLDENNKLISVSVLEKDITLFKNMEDNLINLKEQLNEERESNHEKTI